ncbi:MAG: DUF5069 domain-containing protein [Pedosphaera sp.]|nr:DUF5069 domain-containing protein [Pedosphaera sp.]
MSSAIPLPRSPRETMSGWVHLPRFIDKIRLNLVGKLSADYQANLGIKGFDDRWLKAAGLTAPQFIEIVRSSITDGEVCDWIRTNVKRPNEQREFNEYILNHGRESDPAIRERLQLRKQQMGLAHRDDIQVFVDFIDADEGRS